MWVMVPDTLLQHVLLSVRGVYFVSNKPLSKRLVLLTLVLGWGGRHMGLGMCVGHLLSSITGYA